jgi:hypothetical protein
MECDRIGQLRGCSRVFLSGVVAQLVERLICIQEAWGSTPHNSTFLIENHIKKR